LGPENESDFQRVAGAEPAAEERRSPGHFVDVLAAISTDWFFRIPAVRLAEAHSGNGGSTHVLVLLLLAAPSSAPAATPQRGSVQALIKLLRSRRAAIGNGLLLVIGIVGGTLWSLVPLLVAHRLGGAGVIAAILAVSYLLAALMNVFLGRISDRFGRLLPTLVGLAVAAALLPMIPFLGPLSALFIVSVAAQSVVSALWTPTAAMVSDGAEGTAAGQAVGVATMNAAWATGGASGPVLAAWLADAAGFPLPFALAGGLCATSAVVVLIAYRRGGEPKSAVVIATAVERR
jgi:predicted MFS family arabinose efflux permease